MTEAEMLKLLRDRYTERDGNGEAWAFVPHVRNKAGFDASRTADAIAMSLWPSRGLHLHGFEIKTSRSDWARELKNPAKAETFCQLVDYWWLVVAETKIVRPGELPPGWGLLYANGPGTRLFCKTEAKPLRAPEEPAGPPEGEDPAAWARTYRRQVEELPDAFSRSFLAALLRSAARVSEATPADVQIAVEAARAEERDHAKVMLDLTNQALDESRARESAFERIAGVTIGQYGGLENVERVAAATRAVLQGDVAADRIRASLGSLRRQAASIVEHVDRTLEQVEEHEARV